MTVSKRLEIIFSSLSRKRNPSTIYLIHLLASLQERAFEMSLLNVQHFE
ncbi:hypothetical protein [Nonlabens agnitus]|nr:hypothetical protein [Nonlabens agnitus]